MLYKNTGTQITLGGCENAADSCLRKHKDCGWSESMLVCIEIAAELLKNINESEGLWVQAEELYIAIIQNSLQISKVSLAYTNIGVGG